MAWRTKGDVPSSTPIAKPKDTPTTQATATAYIVLPRSPHQ